MKILHIKPAFCDKRGTITDILDNVMIDSLTILDTKKDSVRANHYHKKTIQYTYVFSGKLRYVSKSPKGKIESVIMKKGDLATSKIYEQHAFKALEDSILICGAKGPRRGHDYENDTFRLSEDELLIK